MEAYIEETSIGDCFEYNNKHFIVTSDFKKNGDRCCLDTSSGLFQWLKPSTIVKKSNLYFLDSNNNFSPIRHETNPSSVNQIKNLS